MSFLAFDLVWFVFLGSVWLAFYFVFCHFTTRAARDGRDEQSIRAVLAAHNLTVEGFVRRSDFMRLRLGGAFLFSTSVRIYEVATRGVSGEAKPVFVSIDPFGHLLKGGSRVRVRLRGAWVD